MWINLRSFCRPIKKRGLNPRVYSVRSNRGQRSQDQRRCAALPASVTGPELSPPARRARDATERSRHLTVMTAKSLLGTFITGPTKRLVHGRMPGQGYGLTMGNGKRPIVHFRNEITTRWTTGANLLS